MVLLNGVPLLAHLLKRVQRKPMFELLTLHLHVAVVTRRLLGRTLHDLVADAGGGAHEHFRLRIVVSQAAAACGFELSVVVAHL